jgi:hypothetical protein
VISNGSKLGAPVTIGAPHNREIWLSSPLGPPAGS